MQLLKWTSNECRLVGGLCCLLCWRGLICWKGILRWHDEDESSVITISSLALQLTTPQLLNKLKIVSVTTVTICSKRKTGPGNAETGEVAHGKKVYLHLLNTTLQKMECGSSRRWWVVCETKVEETKRPWKGRKKTNINRRKSQREVSGVLELPQNDLMLGSQLFLAALNASVANIPMCLSQSWLPQVARCSLHGLHHLMKCLSHPLLFNLIVRWIIAACEKWFLQCNVLGFFF